MSETLLSVRGLTVHYPVRTDGSFRRRTEVVRAVDGIDLDVPRGTTFGLVGETGSGKSTLGRAILQLTPPTAGTVDLAGVRLTSLRGEALRHARRRMQMVFQNPLASLDPRQRIGSIIEEPFVAHGVYPTRAERTARVAELIALVGLAPDVVSRRPQELSGGQRQRVGIARAIALHPDLVVADEPVSALDVSIQAQIINLLQDLQSRLGLTYLLIAHDLAVVHHISHVIAVMYLGRIVELADSDEIVTGPRHPYTVALLSAVPESDPSREGARRRVMLPGTPPSPVHPPAGCAFHTRCWLRERLGRPPACETQSPPLMELTAGHLVSCHFADRILGSLPPRIQETTAAADTATVGATVTEPDRASA